MDDRFDRLFEDLEAAARGREAHERAGEYADRVAEAYAELGLAQRLAGARGQRVQVAVRDVIHRGELAELGEDWLLLEDAQAGRAVLIAFAAIDYASVPGGGGAAVGLAMSMRSELRRIARKQRQVRIETLHGLVLDVGIIGVGRDFVHVRQAQGADVLIPLAALAVVSARRQAV